MRCYTINMDVLAQAQFHHLRTENLERRRCTSEFAPLFARGSKREIHRVKTSEQSLRRERACNTTCWGILAERTQTSRGANSELN
jgi:hypothetical protein